MARKTFRIRDLVIEINRRNKVSTCSAEVRHGWNSVLENILFDADAYSGFGYLNATEVPEGHLPGIIRSENGNEFPDDSRRFYYLKP